MIDLGDATLMPGFIDAHTHLTMDFNPDYNGAMLKGLQTTIAERSIRATVNARKDSDGRIHHGARCGLRATFIDVGLRNAINSGNRPGAAHAGGGPRARLDRRPL